VSGSDRLDPLDMAKALEIDTKDRSRFAKIDPDIIKALVEQIYVPRVRGEHGIQLSCGRGPRNMAVTGRNEKGETAAFPVKRRRDLFRQMEEIELAVGIVVENLSDGDR
jgi:hypothetical protein